MFIIDTILLAAITATALWLEKYLLNNGISTNYSAIISVVFVAAVYPILKNIFLELPMLLPFIRPFLKRESRLEGLWISRLKNIEERPYSLITIGYDPNSKEYTYKGDNFYPDGTIGATWNSSFVRIDMKQERLWFFFDASMTEKDSEPITGYGVVNFDKSGIFKYTRGNGFFADTSVKSEKSHFFIDRLEKDDLKLLIGKKSLQHHQDVQELIKNYHKKQIH